MTRFAVAWLTTLWASTAAHANTREAMLAIAESYRAHVWTATSANQTADCSSEYESDFGPGTYTGVAYDWGGFDTLASYDQNLADGEGAGSHSWHGVLECTTGVDCSGYLSRCWEVSSKYGTSTIHQISHPIDAAEVLEGDAYNDAGSHIVLWESLSAAGEPRFYEATSSKVRYNASATWGYLDGYAPIRFDDVAEAPAEAGPGTSQDPIVITEFPFEDQRSTSSTGQSQLDAYGCAPEIAEAGPEVVYVFTLAEPGDFHATLEDGPGVDIDLHLLSDLDPAACLDRGHTEVGPMALEPGTYYLVADSWSQDGTAYAGWYALVATFMEEAAAEEEDPPPPAEAEPADPVDPADPEEPPPPSEEPRSSEPPAEEVPPAAPAPRTAPEPAPGTVRWSSSTEESPAPGPSGCAGAASGWWPLALLGCAWLLRPRRGRSGSREDAGHGPDGRAIPAIASSTPTLEP